LSWSRMPPVSRSTPRRKLMPLAAALGMRLLEMTILGKGASNGRAAL